MEDKRLDLDAPLLSTRRFASESDSSATRNPNPVRSTLPFYKSDLKTGPIRRPGVVPFVWEQTPGRPKPHPGRISNPKESDNPNTHGNEEEIEERFSDALETFSMNCSVSGMSEMTERVEGSGSFSNDPQVRDFMMGRFLQAAKAMATESTHASSLRKPREPMRTIERVENGGQGKIRYPMSYQHDEGTGCIYDDEEDEDDEYEEDDRYGNGNLLSKGCGLIPKFCLLNPIPGIKVSGRGLPPTSVRRNRSPQVKAMQLGSFGQVEEEYSWEAVYKHKQMHGNPPFQREDYSKLTSESYHLTYLSDSLTPDGSSPQRRSVGGISPYRNEPSQSPFHEGKSFLVVPRTDQKGSKTDGSDSFEIDSVNNWIAAPHHSSQSVSGSASPAVYRTLHVDTVHMSVSPNSKSSSLRSSSDNKGIIRSAKEDSEVGVEIDGMDESHRMDPEVGVESHRMYENLIPETRDSDVLQSKGTSFNCSSFNCSAIDVNNGFKPNDIDESPLPLKENNQVKNDADPIRSLLPPPLPNSPSESWLNRTLPSVSSKNPSSQSFLGIHLQPRKQSATPSLVIPKKEITVKSSKVHHSRTRFADMLAKPLSPKSVSPKSEI